MSYKALDFDWLEKIIVPAIDLFYTTQKDRELIIKYNASERAIIANIYCKMNSLFQKSQESNEALQRLSIDVEYNRNCIDTKKAYLKCRICERSCCFFKPPNNSFNFDESDIVPDMIIHQRGSNKDNQVVIEFKKATNRDEKQRNNDIAKLTYLTCQQPYNGNEDSDYKYRYGYFIDLEKKLCTVTSYIDAQSKDSLIRREGKWVKNSQNF